MRKVSRILFLVGGIINFVSAAALFISSIVCIVLAMPFMDDLYIEGMNYGASGANVDAGLIAIKSFLITFAVFGIFYAVVCLVGGFKALEARKSEERKASIIAIVFGALTNEVILVAAILSTIAITRKNNREKQIEAK